MRVAVLLCLLALLLAACTRAPESEESTGEDRVLVFAAASLTEAMTAFTQDLDAQSTLDPVYTFASSDELVIDLLDGATADVLVTANGVTMEQAQAAGLVEEPTVFASNTVTIAVTPGNPHGVASLADLSTPGLRVAACTPEVPCGATTVQVAEGAGVALAPDFQERSAADAIGRITSGEADAAVVWSTEIARHEGQIERVDFPEARTYPSEYWIASTTAALNPEGADRFIANFTGPSGKRRLAEAGFQV